MKRVVAVAKVCLLLCGTFLVMAFGTRALVARLAPAEPPPRAPRVESFDFDRGMRRFTGALSPAAHREARRTADGTFTLAVVLRAQDIVTCEDLGRQLRELHRAYGPARPLQVWADSPAVVESFVQREHLARVVVRPLAPRAVMGDGRDLATPAALLVDDHGRVVEGVSHVLRAPNARLQSFAQELTLLPHRPPQPGTPAPAGVPGADKQQQQPGAS